MDKYEKKRIGLYMDGKTLELCDLNGQKADARNRSEFISKAVEFYSICLTKDLTARMLAPALENLVADNVNKAAARVSNNLFRLSVEISVLAHMIAYAYEIDDDTLSNLYDDCVREVKQTYGNVKLIDIVKKVNDSNLGFFEKYGVE